MQVADRRWAARATKASRPSCSACRARSATSSTPTPSRTSWRYAQLQNKRRRLRRSPTTTTFKAAAAGADWTKTLLPGADRPAGQGRLADHRRDVHPDAQGAGQAGAAPAEVLKFFDWAYANGDKMADELDYVPLPDAVKDAGAQAVGRRSRTPPARPSPASELTARRHRRAPPTHRSDRRGRYTARQSRYDEQRDGTLAPQAGRRRRARAPWADTVFSLLAHGAALLTLALLAGIIVSLVDRRLAGDPRSSASASSGDRVGSGAEQLRRPGDDLRHAGHLAHRAAHRGAGELRHRAVPDRAVARAGCAPARHRDRAARGDSVDRLRHVGPARVRAALRRVRAAAAAGRCRRRAGRSARCSAGRRSASACCPPASSWRS